jgi:S-layer protein
LDASKATYEGSSGVDTVTVSTTVGKAITLGAGDDVLDFATSGSTVVPTAVVDGGAGIDTLKLTATQASTSNFSLNTQFAQKVTGFEVLDITTGSQTVAVDVLGFSGTAFTIKSEAGAGLILTGLVSGQTLAIAGTNSGTITAGGAFTGTSDSLNIALSTATGGTVIATGVESLTVTNSVVLGAPSALAITDATAPSLPINGASTGMLTLTGSAVPRIDASAYTGGVTIAAGATGQSITGGKVANVLSSGFTGTTLVAGNAGDTLTASASGVTVVGGAGNDAITAVTGDTVTTGGGQDTVTFAAPSSATVATYATITDIAKSDTIVIGNAVAFVSAGVTQGAGATLQNYADAAVTAAGGTQYTLAWFQYSGDTYLVEHNASGPQVAFTNGQDAIIKLTGVVDLSKAVFDLTAHTLLIG